MAAKRTDRRAGATSKRQASDRPIRWTDLPHKMLWDRVLDGVGAGSSARASEDSLKYVLRRRLPSLEPGDHFRYVEVECRRLVETLRVTRDVYRVYLQKEGCKPVAEMYWVVFRFAVIPCAVKLLREAASAYVIDSKVAESEWQTLYGYSWPEVIPIPPELKNFTRPRLSIQGSDQYSYY